MPVTTDAPAPKAGQACTDDASATKAAPRDALPTKDALLAPHAPDIANASTALLINSIDDYLEAVFLQLHGQLKSTIESLAEPPPAREPGFASKLIGFLVENTTGLVANSVGTAFAALAMKTLGDLAAPPVKNLITAGSKAVMSGVGKLSPGLPGNRSLPATGNAGFADPSAKTLLDEFRARQTNRLYLAHADARMTLGGVAERMSSFDRGDIERLLVAVREAANDGPAPMTRRFSEQITVGWMNLAASLALGTKASPDDPDMPGADKADGIRGGTEVAAWRGVHHGFVEVVVNLPEVLRGTLGLGLARASVPTSPGTALMLQRMELPLMGIPVYRRVTLVQPGEGPLLSSPAVVITPEGHIETDASNEQLAAIGSGIETPAMDTHTRFGEGASASTRGTYAMQGARMVAAWLGLFPASVIR